MDDYSDDASSVASYEDVEHPSPCVYEEYPADGHPRGLDSVARRRRPDRSLAPLSETAIHDALRKREGAPAYEPPPDVSYIFRCRMDNGKLVEMRRSSKPIDDDDVDGANKGMPRSPPTKSILEVVTTVSRVKLVTSRRKHPYSPSSPPSPVYGTYENEFYPPPAPPGVRQAQYEDRQKQTKLVINSEPFINALRAVVEYPNFHTNGQSITFHAPYALLVHYRDALAHHKDNQPETHDEEYKATVAKHIDLVLEWLDNTMGQRVAHELELHKKEDTPMVTFDNIWLLFKAGDVVFAQEGMKWTPFIVSDAYSSGYVAEDIPPSAYTVVCWNIGASADRLVRRMRMFSIQPFNAEEPISGLRVVPAAFFRGGGGGGVGEESNTEPEAAMKREIELGKLAWKYHSSGPSYMAYSGALAHEWGPDSELDDDEYETPTGYMTGRVVVDSQGYRKFGYDCPSGGSYRRPPPPHARMGRPVGGRDPYIVNTDGHRPPQLDSLPYLSPRCGCKACVISNRGSSSNSQNRAAPPPPRPLSRWAEMIKDLDPSKPNQKPPTSDLYYLVLSNVVPAFLLGDRRWGHIDVSRLRDITFDKDAFRSLVLEDDIKLTVKALIGQFGNKKGKVSPWPKDVVVSKNKGQGRIFLLHGSPGVGKTCTAEAAAELSRRPLLSLTSGDLTTAAFAVERNLEYFLALGERFGAIVLLDEADVYLETRRSRDIVRNGLVSVFLRGLEYYRGILFLTTNRVEQFDPAFVSRVHVALHYRALTDENRERIWENSFERLEVDSKGKVRVSVGTREYAYRSREIAGLEWNGREIRNALQTAVALAETEEGVGVEEEEQEKEDGEDGDGGEKGGKEGRVVMVTDKHLRAVVKMSRSFKDYLKKDGVGKEDELAGDKDLDDDEDGPGQEYYDRLREW